MHGAKPNKGLIKRCRVTKTGKVKVQRPFGRHLRSHKSGSKLRGYRKPLYVAKVDLKTMGDLLNRRLIGGRSESSAASEKSAD